MNDGNNTNPLEGLKHANAGYYKQFTENWSTRECGPKPSTALFSAVHLLDPKKRPGVECLHIAMCLRPGGCTVRQFQIAGSCGPANNYRRTLVNAGVLKVTVEGKPYAYVATVTPKGLKAIEKAVAANAAAEATTAAEKPARAAAKPKRKAKAKPATPVAATPETAPTATPDPVAAETVAAGDTVDIQPVA